MFVIVWHEFVDPPRAFARGERLKRSEGAPAGTRVLQFYPGTDGRAATCLWQSESVEDVQAYVDETLGDTTRNRYYAVETAAAFAEQPKEFGRPPAAVAA